MKGGDFVLAILALAFATGGCKAIVRRAEESARPQEMVKPAPTAKPASFVGVFAKADPVTRMKVQFTPTDKVTVDGNKTSAEGTYVDVGQTAVATFQTTNNPDFDRAIFQLSDDGNTLSFLGPGRTEVVLKRSG